MMDIGKDIEEAKVYRYLPRGSITFSRLLKGLAPGKKLGLRRINKNQTLIIADYTAEHWSLDKIKVVQSVLHHLLQQQFRLYLWQGTRLVTLTLDNLSILEEERIRQQVTIAPKKQIKKMATCEAHLVHDQIHVLNDYDLDALISNARPQRQIFISSLTKSSHSPRIILNTLKQQKPTPDLFIQDVFSPVANQLIQICRQEFPDRQIVKQYKEIHVNELLAEELLNKNIMILHKEACSIEDLKSVTTLKCNNLRVNTLKKLTNATVDLKQLSLTGVEDITTELEFGTVERLLIESAFSPNKHIIDLGNVLRHADRLEDLQIKSAHCKMTNPLWLNKLRHLTLHHIEYDDSLNTLLQDSKLSYLSLFSIKQNLSHLFESFNSEQLEYLNLAYVSLSSSSLKRVITQAKNLKYLSLSKIDIQVDDLIDPLQTPLMLSPY